MASIRDLDPRAQPLVRAFLQFLADHGLVATVTSTRRDPVKQAQLWECFQRTGCSDCRLRPGHPKCVPAAPPGQSTHAIGAAFDLHLDPDIPEAYAAAGAVWERLGYTWGGRFRDPIHFDLRTKA